MIKANQCSLLYKEGTLALKPFDLSIGAGETVLITGPSGSGKTSLLKLILGIEVPTSGTFEVLGQPICAGVDQDIRRMRTKIGPVFQDFRLLEGRSVLENVMLGLRFLDFSLTDMNRIAGDYIQRVGLEHKMNQSVDRLSWGECQRVAIARAVSRRPKLIVADEPTGNLDHTNAVNVLNLLASFNDSETSVIITTHATHLVNEFPSTSRLIIEGGVFTHKGGHTHV